MLASGSATIVHDGSTHDVDGPEVVPLSAVEDQFSPTDQRAHRLFGVQTSASVSGDVLERQGPGERLCLVSTFGHAVRGPRSRLCGPTRRSRRVRGHGSISGGELYPEAISGSVSGIQPCATLIGPRFEVGRLREPTSVVAFESRRAGFHGAPVVPVLVDGASIPPDAELPAECAGSPSATPTRCGRHHSPATWRRWSLTSAGGWAPIPTCRFGSCRSNDRPANNEYKSGLLRPAGIIFDNVGVGPREAIEQLKNEIYDLVITDLGREGSTDRSP